MIKHKKGRIYYKVTEWWEYNFGNSGGKLK